MTKVYPRAENYSIVEEEKKQLVKSSALMDDASSSVQLTVWKKSLLLNCNGFTVYDATGNLVYRVDNYGTRAHDIFLMDASGNSLFTIRRKRLSLGDNWMVFKGETAANPLFTAKKHINLLNGKSLAHVNSSLAYADRMGSCSTSSYQQQQQQLDHSKKMMKLTYEIQGSYTQRCCVVYDHTTRRRVAEIRRKDSTVGGICLGLDVFRLVILQPNEIDSASAMAFVILLDQMFAGQPSTTSR